MAIKIEFENRDIVGRKKYKLKPGATIGLGYRPPRESRETDFYSEEDRYDKKVTVKKPDEKTGADKVSVESATSVDLLVGNKINNPEAGLKGTTKRLSLFGSFTVEEVTVYSVPSVRQRVKSLISRYYKKI